jgi:DNA-binding transcriptional ArsR family regulator
MRSNKSRNTLILHPIRIRIFGVLAGRKLTTEQIGQLMDDVPPATLYRHINDLIRGGLIVVVGEQRQQGRTTRVLMLKEGAGLLDRGALSPKSAEENAQAVNIFLAGLMAVYASALRDPHVEPDDWRLAGYSAYLSVAEERMLARKINALLDAACDNPRKRGRRRRMLAFGSLPDRELPAQSTPTLEK